MREQGTDSLQLPAPDKLAAGPFAAPGNYEAYHQLMRDCRRVLQRGHTMFGQTGRRLVVCHAPSPPTWFMLALFLTLLTTLPLPPPPFPAGRPTPTSAPAL